MNRLPVSRGLYPLLALAWLLGGGVSAAPAQEPEPSPEEEAKQEEKDFELGGFVDLYYAYNANRPFNRENFVPGAGIAAKRSDEVQLNLVALEIKRDPRPVGFHVIAGIGDELEILHLGEPEGEGVGRDTFENLYRASVSYAVSDRLLIEAGVYPSHIGFESGLTRDNWNYTGSWAANFSPYYQAGVKAVYTFVDGWSAGLHVVNGWQIIGDNNDGKSLGAHLGWSSDRGFLTLNAWVGPELPDDDSSLRTLWDLVGSVNVSDDLALGFEADLGRQELPGSDAAEWTALAGYLRYRLAPAWAVAVRAEQVDDPDGGISGLPQTIEEGTLTFEHRPHERVILKLEGRYDRSTEPIFASEEEGPAEKDQLLFVLGSIFTF